MLAREHGTVTARRPAVRPAREATPARAAAHKHISRAQTRLPCARNLVNGPGWFTHDFAHPVCH